MNEVFTWFLFKLFSVWWSEHVAMIFGHVTSQNFGTARFKVAKDANETIVIVVRHVVVCLVAAVVVYDVIAIRVTAAADVFVDVDIDVDCAIIVFDVVHNL